MSNIQIFNFQGNNVRSMVLDGEPWFVGKDVAEALGYSNPRDALMKHVDEEDKGVAKCDTLGGVQEITFINESGVYALVFGSKLPIAKKFKHWITADVLPTIRKTGSYTYKPITDPMEMLQLHYNVLDKHDKELKEVDHRLKEVEMNQRLKWRDQMMNLVHRGCNLTGLPQSVFLGQRVYPELENRTGRSLDKTLRERRKRMKKQGYTTKAIRAFYKIDLIESEKQLRIAFEDILNETLY
ncbi:BRO-N domain-containing protein [Holdemania massiliensis]|uniref:BRO-N domain-containing protein n=1 Tax=Holdemania massiliensis TaxID=1468449 RepID=UPI001F0675D8|nr:Bro-N domain-containing protein [Holdemania massiliensis]MCH1941570.1 Bro-N domain-containing protein [Holdemania massiliensis]